MDQWSKKIQTNLESLDINAKKLINLYKQAVVHIFERFFNDLKTLATTLTQEDDQSNFRLNFDNLEGDLYKSIVTEVAELYTCDIAELQVKFSKEERTE